MPLPKHLVSIHTLSHFVKCFLKKLSYNSVNGLLTHKTDGQPVGEAHDGASVMAVAALHTVVVGAVGFRHGNFSVLHCDDIPAAAVGGDGEFPVDPQVHKVDQDTLTEDLGMGGSIAWQQHGNAQTDAGGEQHRQKQDPGSRFHRECTSWNNLPASIAKHTKKRKKKLQFPLDFY